MYERSRMQPDPMKDYILEDEDSNRFLGRWLVGKVYEGWYIKAYLDKQGAKHECTPAIYSQKELHIMWYEPADVRGKRKRYIPKKTLDAGFWGLAAIQDFRDTPEMEEYL
ncbi:MAG: hypothetical protein J6U54_11010 [Clostridiales bacterium]|nr:hypothetical protein [Clostridiales bacterium]